MTIALPLIQALVLAAVVSVVWALLDGGPWTVRPLIARWLALALLAWGILAGPIKIG